MTLRDKYNHAVQTAKGFRMQGSADERDGKLYFKGTVQTQDEANKIWDAIKTVPDWPREVVADIKATGPAAAPAAPLPRARRPRPIRSKQATRSARSPRTISASPNAYMDIFNANRDLLDDPTRSSRARC